MLAALATPGCCLLARLPVLVLAFTHTSPETGNLQGLEHWSIGSPSRTRQELSSGDFKTTYFIFSSIWTLLGSVCIVCECVCTHMCWCSWWNMYMLAYTKELGLDYVNKFLTGCFQRRFNLRIQLLRWANYSLGELPGRRGMRTFLFPGRVWGMGE